VIHQLADPVGDKIPALQRARFEKDHQHLPQLVAHPVNKWQGETLLLAIENFSRHTNAFGKFAQNVFLLVTVELPIDRETRSQLYKDMVKDRHAHLQRVQHTHAVDLGQDVGDHVGLRINVQKLANWVFRRGFSEVPAQYITGVVPVTQHV